jgi:zinc and cadmium transporter
VSAALSAGLAVVGVSALSLLGLVALRADEARVQRSVPLLASLATGALVGGAVFDLIPEAIARHASAATVTIGAVGGFLGFWAFEQMLHHIERGRGSENTARRRHPIVTLNFIGDALHNAADGAMIAAAFLSNPAVGMVTTLAIILHEIPRELGSFGVFVHGGVSVRRAVVYNGLTGLAAVASAGLTLAIGARVVGVATTALPIAAGTFLYIAVSITPRVIHGAPSIGDRVVRLALASGALIATAVAAHLG